MKILLAAPDRDLLECYKQLLEEDFGEAVTAFDGTQVFTLLAEESFDLVILDRDIPRIDHKTLLARINAARIPAIVLTDSPGGESGESEETLLPYPFTPEKLAGAIRAAIPEKKRTGKENENE